MTDNFYEGMFSIISEYFRTSEILQGIPRLKNYLANLKARAVFKETISQNIFKTSNQSCNAIIIIS